MSLKILSKLLLRLSKSTKRVLAHLSVQSVKAKNTNYVYLYPLEHPKERKNEKSSFEEFFGVLEKLPWVNEETQNYLFKKVDLWL